MTRHLPLAGKVRQHIQDSRSQLIDFAAALIEIRSENPPGAAYEQCAERIVLELRRLGLRHEVVHPALAPALDTAPSVLGHLGSGDRTLYFHGHYDVVPAHDTAQFRPYLRHGNLYGRGASDMKGGIASMVFAVHALAACGFQPTGTLQLVLVPDEETAGPRGTAALVAARALRTNAIGMLTAEPTGGVIWNANRGALSLRITTHGTPAHVGLHFRGVNAFSEMLRLAGELTTLGEEVARRETRYHIRPARARRSILMLGGELAGGTNFNVVPDRASFTVDRRLNPEEDLSTERQHIMDVIDRARTRGATVEVETIQEGLSSATPETTPLATSLAASIQDVTGRTANFELCPGLLEIRYYASLGVPALAYGPGLLTVSHGPREFVPVRRLLDCAHIYALTAIRLLSPTL
jgi:succinyl-diaminopimelate desuccinylase